MQRSRVMAAEERFGFEEQAENALCFFFAKQKRGDSGISAARLSATSPEDVLHPVGCADRPKTICTNN